MKNIRLLAKRLSLFFIVLLLILPRVPAQIIHLPHAYAHNDYWHKRPLLDALENGFTYIEADIYLRHSRLVVTHRFPLLKKKHTIEELYLEPFLSRLANTHQQAQTALDTIVLMIDIKSNGKKTYTALRETLNKYKDILSTCEKGKVTVRNLTLVITGHRPLQILESEACRFVFADADLRKLNRDEEYPKMFTTASCKYSSLIKWRGKGIIPAFEKERLQELVIKAHLSGTKVRLWGSPENEKVWLFLRNCGVDLINTDKLLALKRFFIKDIDRQQLTQKL